MSSEDLLGSGAVSRAERQSMVMVREQEGRVGEEIDATRRDVFYTPLFVARAWVECGLLVAVS